MLDEKKVRLMARTVLYEQSLGDRAIKQNTRFKKGALKAALFNNIPAGVLTYILVAAFVLAFSPEQAREWYGRLGFTTSVLILVIVGIIFVFLYSLYSRYMFKKKYENNKGIFWKYNFTRDKLNRILSAGKKAERTGGRNA